MKATIERPSFDVERYRKPKIIFGFFALPPSGLDNSGAALAVSNLPFLRLSTGALGINKGQEYGYPVTPVGTIAPSDGYAINGDPDTKGFWRRVLIVDCYAGLQGTAGTLSPTSYYGIGIGSYGAVPPDPATTTSNVIRLRARLDAPGWELLVHRGDGVSAATVATLAGVNPPSAGVSQHLRIVYVPGQSVRAIMDGVVGAEVTATLPLVPPTAGNVGANIFAASGSASANVRAFFRELALEVRGEL